MKLHYFQRYHSPENVATGNTMLLLSRLYQYSPDKFFRLLKNEFFSDNVEDDFEPEIVFQLQERNQISVPDATITQDSFKIVVETKLGDSFNIDQLERHLDSFGVETYKLLISLAPGLMPKAQMKTFTERLRQYNEKLLQQHREDRIEQQKEEQSEDHNSKLRKAFTNAPINPIIHVNTTFENLANAVQSVLDPNQDYEMQEVLDDYVDYCYFDKLIPESDSWKFMRMKKAGTTMVFNRKYDLYYDDATRGFRPHDYLGLYTKKTICAIGKICARITAEYKGKNEVVYDVEFGELTDKRKELIEKAAIEGEGFGYKLKEYKHRYFFVEKFYDTKFIKKSPYAPMGARVFDLTQVLGIENPEKEKMPSTEEIAKLLRDKKWK